MSLPFTALPTGMPFIELQSVDSTNKYAMTLIKESGLPDRQLPVSHGMAIFAHEQSDGKGRYSRKWSSEKGKNIALSLLLNPFPLVLSSQFKLSVCTIVSVHELFLQLAGIETKIKWPNDLYWRDRKAGGVLIENIVSGQHAMDWKWAVVGIGININQLVFPDDLPNPVSLKQITGKEFDPVGLAKQLCLVFHKNYQQLLSGEFATLFQYYLTHLYKIHEVVKLKKENRVFDTTVVGVSDTGQLITRHTIEERFSAGEVEWIINKK